MNNTAKIIVAVLAGAAAGVVAGILLAPDKGSETRKKVAEAGRKVSSTVSDMLGACKKEFANSEES